VSVRSAVLRAFRRQGVATLPLEDEIPGPEPPREVGPVLRLSQALDRLEPRARQLLRLRFWDALGQREVAGLLGVTRQRVQQIEAKALGALREALGPRGGATGPGRTAPPSAPCLRGGAGRPPKGPEPPAAEAVAVAGQAHEREREADPADSGSAGSG
jgi:hypothetical protein